MLVMRLAFGAASQDSLGNAMDLIEDVIARLSRAFPHAELHEPASEASIESFAETFGALPAELIAFLRTSNGLDLHLSDGVVGRIYGLTDMQRVLGFSRILRDRDLVPVRDDMCGNYDCIDIGPGPTRGAVLFWDHEIYERPAYLLGGDFAAYLDMWSDYVLTRFVASGEEDPSYRPKKLDSWPWVGDADRTHPWPFDEKWMRARDPRADLLLGNRFLRSRLVRGE
jgi:hypothetical protein